MAKFDSRFKRGMGIDVLTAARQRISKMFDDFSKICISFSGGKDSSTMLHLVMDEAICRNRRVGLLFIDLEGQYKLTIEHVIECFALYRDHIEPFWIALPLRLRNAVSVFESQWVCWDPSKPAAWVRQPDALSIVDPNRFPFFRLGMEFEEFVPAFGEWFSQGQPTCCMVGIRTDESLNRWRTISSSTKAKHDGLPWTTVVSPNLINAYPIYDWKVSDLWVYAGKTGKPYNQLYDRMRQAGLTLTQMRICQPYGDDQRRGLWLFHLIEPETWARIVARVNGANSGALYICETGNFTGNLKISKPEGHTWESFAQLLLESLPLRTKEHFKNKIAQFIHFWAGRGYPDGIPDEMPAQTEAKKEAPSWRRICKALLRNDYWCKGLSFAPQKSTALDQYLARMKKRRAEWGLLT